MSVKKCRLTSSNTRIVPPGRRTSERADLVVARFLPVAPPRAFLPCFLPLMTTFGILARGVAARAWAVVPKPPPAESGRKAMQPAHRGGYP